MTGDIAVRCPAPPAPEAATTRWIWRVSAVVWRASEYGGHGVTRGNWLDKEWLSGAEDPPTQDDVLAWLDRERPNLAATVQQAAQYQLLLAIRLANGLNAYYAGRVRSGEVLRRALLAST